MAQAEKLFVRKVTLSGETEGSDMLAVEEPLEIRVAYGPENARVEKPISITMRTPGHDDELALGFLFTEGIMRSRNEIMEVGSTDTHVVTIRFRHDVKPMLASLDRNFYTTSSCGVCGKSSLDAVKTKSVFPDVKANLQVSSELLNSLQSKLQGNQKVFEVTGGLHASALFDSQGHLTLVREDVGRHNALDKLVGASLMNQKLPLSSSLLLLSGRISFELVQKAYMAGIKIVAAIGAPSTLAVSLAEECNMTLVGFLRDNRFTVYTGKQRIE